MRNKRKFLGDPQERWPINQRGQYNCPGCNLLDNQNKDLQSRLAISVKGLTQAVHEIQDSMLLDYVVVMNLVNVREAIKLEED